MSKSNMLEKLDALFEDLDKPDVHKLESLVAETLKCFEYLRDRLQSSDPAVKEEAMELTYQLQRKLETLAEKALASAGLDRQQLQALISNPQNFSQEQWNAFQESEHAIQEYKEDILKNKDQQ